MKNAGTIEDRAGPMSRFPDRAGPAVRQIHSKRGELRFGIGAEADSDDDIADGVFENQIPADDPGEDFAQRGVGIGVGAAGDGDHGGKLGVTKTGKAAGQRDEKKRNRDGGSGGRAPVHEHGRGTAMPQIIDEQVEDLGMQDGGSLEIFSGGSRPGENKNSRADDGADAQCREGPGTEGLFQAGAQALRPQRLICRCFCSIRAAKSRAAAGRARGALAGCSPQGRRVRLA